MLMIPAALVVLGILFYVLAVSSRRRYRCPKCGEKLLTEYLDAKRCGMCGAPLERSL
jgi:ribosomal protein S27AE